MLIISSLLLALYFLTQVAVLAAPISLNTRAPLLNDDTLFSRAKTSPPNDATSNSRHGRPVSAFPSPHKSTEVTPPKPKALSPQQVLKSQQSHHLISSPEVKLIALQELKNAIRFHEEGDREWSEALERPDHHRWYTKSELLPWDELEYLNDWVEIPDDDPKSST